MADVRSAIDQIDREVVRMIGRRKGLVEAAAAFKTSAAGVRAADRQRIMLATRRQWATDEGLDPEMIEELFANLVQRFIAHEMERFDANRED